MPDREIRYSPPSRQELDNFNRETQRRDAHRRESEYWQEQNSRIERNYEQERRRIDSEYIERRISLRDHDIGMRNVEERRRIAIEHLRVVMNSASPPPDQVPIQHFDIEYFGIGGGGGGGGNSQEARNDMADSLRYAMAGRDMRRYFEAYYSSMTAELFGFRATIEHLRQEQWAIKLNQQQEPGSHLYLRLFLERDNLKLGSAPVTVDTARMYTDNDWISWFRMKDKIFIMTEKEYKEINQEAAENDLISSKRRMQL